MRSGCAKAETRFAPALRPKPGCYDELQPMHFSEDSLGIIRVRRWQELAWLVHGWTSRACGDFRRLPAGEELNRTLGVTGMEPRLPQQVHSNRVHAANLLESRSGRPEADGMISGHEGLLLGVRTADCLALLFVDRRHRAVAAVHAGWRGTVQRIAVRGVERMQEEFGSVPREIEVAAGPGIGKCCFEVGQEVADQFDPIFISRHKRPHIDLDAANRGQLSQAGVEEENIWSSNLCTYCSARRFFSHRRDGAAAGRMLAMIGVRAR